MLCATPFGGRTALVTGASAGIGKAICEAFLTSGATVIAVALRPLELEHQRLHSHTVDLSNPAQTSAFAEMVKTDYTVDILVNNAGVVRNTFLEDVDDEEFDSLVNLHMRSALLLAKAAVGGMKERSFGRVINMSSRAVVGLAGRTVYAATKSALISMTRTWALELGPFGITVNCIAPGPVVTDMLTADIPEGSERAIKLAQSIPVRRLGRANDVARAALYFADPENDWVTGQTLFVCGGASLSAALAL